MGVCKSDVYVEKIVQLRSPNHSSAVDSIVCCRPMRPKSYPFHSIPQRHPERTFARRNMREEEI